jgi:hypothetical protein
MGFLYLGLALLGAAASYSFLGQFFIAHGLNFAELKTQLLAGPVSSYFGVNALISVLVTVLFILGEGRRLKMRGLWLPVAATLGVGVCCGLPLFLYLRRLSQDKLGALDESQMVHAKTIK